MADPLISICVPTYNRAKALKESLRSIQGQDYPSLEILISDNCSEDATQEICLQAARLDPRIRYIRQPRNIGLYGNHNFCLREAQGEFICLFHDHDVRDLRMVNHYATFMKKNPEAGIVCSDWELVDEEGKCIGVREYNVKEVTPGLEFIEQTMRSGRSSVGAPGAMIRRSALGDIRFDEDGPIGFGDFIVWFRIAEYHPVGHIRQRLWGWRQRYDSQSARTIESMARDYYVNLTRYCQEHFAHWPEHSRHVERWQGYIRNYLFWALAFEVGLYFRKNNHSDIKSSNLRTVFEILGYRLSQDAFQHALEQLKFYRTGTTQHIAFLAIESLIRLKVTAPLAWATYNSSLFRMLLGLG